MTITQQKTEITQQSDEKRIGHPFTHLPWDQLELISREIELIFEVF